MIKIVVIEDDKETQIQIKNLINEAEFLKDEKVKINFFTKFTAELRDIIKDNTERKIYITDIELGSKISGIDIARFIREHDWESEIIFITSHDKMFETAYRNVYEIFDFIEKFHHMESRLKKDLKTIYKRNFDNQMFKFNSRSLNLQIYYRSILYFYRDKESRKLIINTDRNKYAINLSLTDSLNFLDNRFKMVHRACVVNTDRVEAYNWIKGYFILDNGEKINLLSKKFKQEVEEYNESNN